MWKVLALIVAGFAVSLLAAQDSRGQTPVIETIALTGDQIPESRLIMRSLGGPSIDAVGDVVFYAGGSLPGFITGSSFPMKSTGVGNELTRIPDIAPGFTRDPNDPVFFLFPTSAIMNSAGTVVFASVVKDDSTIPLPRFSAHVLFTGNSLNDLTALARSDELLDVLQPNAADETLSLQIGEFVLNESGAAAFVVDLFHRLGRDPGALFVPGESGGFVPIVRSGGQAPDTEPGTVFIFFERLVMNTEGDVAFQASLENPAEGIGAEFGSDNFSGIWRIRAPPPRKTATRI